MNPTLTRISRYLAVTGILTLFAASTAAAQNPTPEGTTIRNIASVSFTDANSNAYAAVADTVDVTVGFAAGVDVTGGIAVAPVPGSTGNTIDFTVNNLGNGTDAFTISENIGTAGVINVTGYVYNSVTYASLAALNGQLALDSVAAGDSIVVQVVYDAVAGSGGLSTDYDFTATSDRDVGVNDSADTDTATVSPVETLAVTTTPDGSQNIENLPSNGAPAYTFTFNVSNDGNGSETFDLLAAAGLSGAIAIVSVDGVAGNSTSITLAAGANQDIVVEYTVADIAAGTLDSLYLTATSQTNAGINDQGFMDLEVVRPALAIVKQAWLADRSAQISGEVLPGDFIEYRIEVTNNGDADAATVVVTDALPVLAPTDYVTFVSTDDPSSAFTSINYDGPTGTVTATLSGSLASGASAVFWIRVQVNS